MRISRSLAILALCGSFPYASPRMDGLRPDRFGPYLQQNLDLSTSLAGYEEVVPFGTYSFMAGWFESIVPSITGPMQGTTLEAQGNLSISPFHSDIGTAFNLRPIRFLEFGMGYNRLLYHYTLMGFTRPDGAGQNWLPALDRWKASEILAADGRQTAGADVFTFQGNFMVNFGRLQVKAGGVRSLWDVDVRDKDILYEYHTGLLIKKRDRINSLYARALLNLDPHLGLLGFTAHGFEIRNSFWWTSQTGLDQNLAAAGITGIRWGRNNSRRHRGLDLLVGIWTEQSQLNGQDWWQRLSLNLQWAWNAQILDLSAD